MHFIDRFLYFFYITLSVYIKTLFRGNFLYFLIFRNFEACYFISILYLDRGLPLLVVPEELEGGGVYGAEVGEEDSLLQSGDVLLAVPQGLIQGVLPHAGLFVHLPLEGVRLGVLQEKN